jgi:hypothetical protein
LLAMRAELIGEIEAVRGEQGKGVVS